MQKNAYNFLREQQVITPEVIYEMMLFIE